MTTVIFDVVDLLDEVKPGDSVVIWPPHITGTGGQVRNTRPRTIAVSETPVSRDVAPGPLYVQLLCDDRTDTDAKLVEVPLPEDAPPGGVTLLDLLRDVFEYTPPVVTEMRQLRNDAVAASDAAAQAVADGAEAVRLELGDEIAGVQQASTQASDAAGAAVQAAESSSLDRAATGEDRTEVAAAREYVAGVKDVVDETSAATIAAAHLVAELFGEGGGVAPHIGENGNWFVGDTDTGVPAQGPPGSGGGGGLVPDPDNDGLYLIQAGSNLTEDPDNPGLYLIGA